MGKERWKPLKENKSNGQKPEDIMWPGPKSSPFWGEPSSSYKYVPIAAKDPELHLSGVVPTGLRVLLQFQNLEWLSPDSQNKHQSLIINLKNVVGS